MYNKGNKWKSFNNYTQKQEAFKIRNKKEMPGFPLKQFV